MSSSIRLKQYFRRLKTLLGLQSFFILDLVFNKTAYYIAKTTKGSITSDFIIACMVESVNLKSNNLEKNSIGLRGLVFQGMGQLSPIGIFGGSILGAASFALGATPLAFIFGFIVALLSANSIFQYSKHVASARGYYGYVGNGMGKIAGGYVSYLYVFYQLANLSFIFGYYVLTFSPTFSYVFGGNISNDYGLLYLVLISIPAFYIVYRGIKPSYKSQIISNSIQIIFVVLMSLIIIITATDNSLVVFTPAATGAGWGGVFLGFITGSYLAFAGYGSIVPLGEEAKAAKRTIGLSVVILVFIMAAIYLLGSYAMIIGWGIADMGTFGSSIYPGFVVVGTHVDKISNYFFFILNFFVVYPLYVTMASAVSRNLYSMSKDGLIPARFSKTHPKYRSPHQALLLTLISFVVISVVASLIFVLTQGGFSGGYFDYFLFFATSSTIATLVIHTVLNVALIRRSGAENKNTLKFISVRYVFPVVSTAFIVVALYYAISTLTMPLIFSPVLVLVYSVFALALALIYKEKAKIPGFKDVGAETPNGVED